MVERDIIALTAKSQAKKGSRFTATILARCINCGLYTLCAKNLREGFSYEVIDTREKVHVCPATQTEMKVVLVKEMPIKVAMDKRSIFEGALTRFPEERCAFSKCTNYSYCNPRGLDPNELVLIERMFKEEKVSCPLNRELVLASLRRQR